MIRISNPITYTVAGLVSAVTMFVVGAFYYDAAMPVIGFGVDRVITPIVQPGGELVVAYIRKAPRQCQIGQRFLTITDASGVVFIVSQFHISIHILDNEFVSYTIPVPPQATKGTAVLNLIYDKVCQVLGFYDSVHPVTRPAVAFIVH